MFIKAQEQEKPGAWGWQSGWRVGPAGDWRCCGSLLSARGPGWRWRGRPGTQTLLHEPWGPGQQMGGRPGYGGGPGVRPAGLSPQQPPGTPDSVRPHGLQPTGLLCPWVSPVTQRSWHLTLQPSS